MVAHLSGAVHPIRLIPPSESGFDVVRDTVRVPMKDAFPSTLVCEGDTIVLVRLPCVLDQASNTFERKPTAVGAGRPHIDRLWQ